ncbi:transcription initiation factor iif, beta subunit [Aspergillus ellipticus CBS 707.79]|uniref:Transcription initiation factor IIF subunit beta n=1 Tax=Aspergillus ellipticus CBS 707.79 TaxID=1448320 RepID=A0A319EAR8_9EURO|nr:transcription initiation factor iif, beta subunit [Aspergillus ellipticus CBS 707.79]
MVPQIKQDPDSQSPYIKPDPYIKADPDSKEAVLADIDDEDLYEDAGDLDFSAAAQSVWLSRIPRSLWEHWSNLSNGGDDDEEVQIGTMRIESKPNDIKRVSLRLNEREDNREIPKDYLLQRQTITAENVSHLTQNTYLFTERDLPGHENRMVVFGEARSALYESMKREMKKKERKKKWEPYVRKTVPKQTALVGSVGEEFNCLPVENEEFRHISEKKALEALKPKRETVFIDKVPGKLLQPRNALPGEKGAFVQAARPTKGKTQENKTTRMPQNELLDLIYQCFREYKYWPFKMLKARLRQPEAYLKQTLEMVAHLVKAGDFAMTWELKPEARESNYASAMAYGDPKEELAPALDYNFDEGSEEEATASGMVTDNDEIQFENV